MRTSMLVQVVLGTALASCQPPTATISAGIVRGVSTNLPNAEHAVNAFLGVPYASKPERFSRATSAAPWNETLRATSFGPACPQNFGINPLGPSPELLDDLFNQADPVEDEDCLNINVWAPAKHREGGYPVLVSVPGGGFQLGHNQVNMSAFAAFEDLVVVNFNYRTNVFGFPGSPDIPVTERNLGLYDQRLAFDWIQENVAAFGGDPSKVTLWGQSAGAISVDFHLRAYAEEEDLPFRAAIMSAGQSSIGLLAFHSPSDQSWKGLAQLVGCPDEESELECLREVPWRNLTAAMRESQLMFSPQLDNVTVTSQPAEHWRSGRVARVPLLTGTVAEEGRGLVNHEIDFDVFLDAYFPPGMVPTEARDAIVSVYEADPKLKTDFDMAAAIYTDYFWQCPQGIHADLAADAGSPTWRYYWNASVTDLIPEKYSWLGVFHGTEIYLLFSQPEASDFTPQLYTLYEAFRGAMGRFIRNPSNGPGWPRVGSSYAPHDLAVVGDVGDEETGGWTVLDRGEVDARCGMYGEIYRALESVTG